MSYQHQDVFMNESVVANAASSSFSPADTSIMSNVELTNILSSNSSSPSEKIAKSRRRKSRDETWKGPKRKPGDESEHLIETSSSDSTSRSTPLSHELVSEASMNTPNSLGFQSDFELSALDPAELIGNKLSFRISHLSIIRHDVTSAICRRGSFCNIDGIYFFFTRRNHFEL